MATFALCVVGYDRAGEDTACQDAWIRSEPNWREVELDSDHLCQWTAPGAVVELLIDAATS
jgi:hypothetical protein